MTKILKSEVFEYGNFFTSLLDAFQKNVSIILEVYFIIKLLINTKYT